MKKKLLIGLVILAVLATSAVGFKVWQGKKSSGLQVITSMAKTDDLVVDIFANGRVELGTENQLQAMTSGLVVEMLAEPGEEVAAGQLLARLEQNELARKLREAQASLDVQKAQLAKAQQGPNEYELARGEVALEQARIREQSAKKRVEQLATLYEGGAIPRSDLEAASRELTLAQLELRVAQEGLSILKKGESSEVIAAVQAQVRQAALNVELLEEQLAATRIIAPYSGVVLRKLVLPGQYVTMGTPIYAIGDMSTMHIKANISEVDVGKLELDLPVIIKGRSFIGKHYEGRIAKIFPLAETTIQDQTQQITVPIIIEVTTPDTVLKPGFTVDLEIITAKAKQAVLVPYEAVVERDKQQVVFVVYDGIAQMRVVETGLGNDFYLQIASGVSHGEVVIINPSDQVVDGIAVIAND